MHHFSVLIILYQIIVNALNNMRFLRGSDILEEIYIKLIFIRHEHKKYSVYTLEISNNNNALRLTTLAKLT